MRLPIFITVFTILLPYFQIISCAKILFVLPLATRSETHLFTPLARELALRGHSVTYVAPQASNLKIKNFREIIPIKPMDASDFTNVPDPLELRKQNQNKLKWLLSFETQFILDGCHSVYNHTHFQPILQESFDLIIFSAIFNQCFEGLVHKFKAPFILFSSMPFSPELSEMTGLRQPNSFVPNAMVEFTDCMNFQERVINTLLNWLFSLLYTYQWAPNYTSIYRHYLGQHYPDLLTLEKNVSLIFSNSYIGVNNARPVLPDIVEIGGIHCRDAQQLPSELDDWLSSSSPNGFIFFSLGSCIQAVTLPEETRKLFLNVFSRLKQKVLWKWESEEMEDLPPNVKLGKWLPQQDILGHKSIKMFISHGGLLSSQEAIYHGVPVLGIPFFVDQDVNMLQAEKIGFSIKLEILELTEEKLEAAINQILNDSKYLQKAREASGIFRDRLQGPLNTAVYWVEYVLRYGGATHLRSSARNLNYFQYHSTDVILFLAIIILFSLWVIVKVVRCLCKNLRKKESSQFDQELGSKKKRQ